MSSNRFCLLLILLSWPLTTYAQWRPQPSHTTASFRAVSAVSQTVVWAGGAGGTFVHTIDGGQHWQADTVTNADKLDFRGVVGFSDREAILMSAGPGEKGQARLYQTQDAGKTWQLLHQVQTAGVFFDGIAFWDRQHGIVFSDPVAGKWFVLFTDDGGKTWQQAQNFPALLPGEAAFAASHSAMVTEGNRNVWIGSSAGRVFRSTDRGRTWSVSQTPLAGGPSSGVFGLRFRDARHGMAVGGDYKQEKTAGVNTAITSDGGETWQAVTPALPSGLKEAIVHLSGQGWLAVGPSGSSVSKDDGKTWQQAQPEGFHAVSCYPITHPDGSPGKTCWAVGGNGKIASQSF